MCAALVRLTRCTEKVHNSMQLHSIKIVLHVYIFARNRKHYNYHDEVC